MEDQLFTTTELTSFGEYLLSPERANHILNSEIEGDPLELLREVHHADFENWKALHGEAGVSADYLIGADELIKIREDLKSGLLENREDGKAGVATFDRPTVGGALFIPKDGHTFEGFCHSRDWSPKQM